MTPEFWRGRRVFLTGHTGFKGAWLSLWLQRLGAIVQGYALAPPTQPSLFEVAAVASEMISETGDVRDVCALSAAVQSFNAEIVIHMAAQSLVRASYDEPVETYATNVMGTVHVLEAVRHTPSVRAVLVITSDKCYQNQEWVYGYREQDALGGRDPYSNSKACAELVTSAYRDSFLASDRLGVATARAGNVIGGGDWARDRLIPDLIQAFINGVPAKIRNPSSVRPWQHVLEPLHGYLNLLEALWNDPKRHAEGWNFGPDERDARPVKWIADELVGCWGKSACWESEGGEHPHEAGLLRLDSAKAHAYLSWQPQLSLAEALRWVTDWYQAYARGENMRGVTLEQIGHYQSKVVA